MLLCIDDYNIYYEFVNPDLLAHDKAVVVVLHDGLGSVSQWRDFPHELSQKLNLPVLLYDRIGYGRSSKRKETNDLEFLKQEAVYYLPNLIRLLNLSNKRLVLFGHSDGATIALLCAALYKTQILAVVSLSAHVVVEQITRMGVQEMIKEYWSGGLKDKLYKYHGTKTDSMFFNWANAWTSANNLNWNILKYLEMIQVPILAIQGENDEYGTSLQVEYIKNKVAVNVESYIIPLCGHMPHIQERDKTIIYTQKFISTLT